ncbi:hypothetical protein EIN_335350 [Entamoeba invadens IP1]|uniref:Uncharacterized protein n=1 Tax=Entamoeba invadens IP1 TaxID=370355 RepID=L7FLB2_ENTIV|nr:hypothetical protein EIN_335350 [Entamoeba invadens IP1]ELP88553.1 hypothetical protein EIN_335350 [Entamoeba invadens IP1]|eukprot:XP_004255324.1 hypothetical protein EIN_335350 [Entamoeba invadens IP1]
MLFLTLIALASSQYIFEAVNSKVYRAYKSGECYYYSAKCHKFGISNSAVTLSEGSSCNDDDLTAVTVPANTYTFGDHIPVYDFNDTYYENSVCENVIQNSLPVTTYYMAECVPSTNKKDSVKYELTKIAVTKYTYIGNTKCGNTPKETVSYEYNACISINSTRNILTKEDGYDKRHPDNNNDSAVSFSLLALLFLAFTL